MGRGRLKSGLQAFGAGRLRRLPDGIFEEIIDDPGGDDDNEDNTGGSNPDIDTGGPIIGGNDETLDWTDGSGVEITKPGRPYIGNGGTVIVDDPFLGDEGPPPPTRDDQGTNNGGGLPGMPRSLPASMPNRSPETRNFPAPATLVTNPNITNPLARGKIDFEIGSVGEVNRHLTTNPTIRISPEFDPSGRNQTRNEYIKENCLVYAVDVRNMVGATLNGLTYANQATKFFNLLTDLFELSPTGQSRPIPSSFTTVGLSAAGFPIDAKSLDSLSEGVSGSNFFSQQFFRYDLTRNDGASGPGLTAGDTITKATLVMTVNSHIVDRHSAPAFLGDTNSVVKGPASVQRRIFEAVHVNATYDADFGKYLSGTSWGHTYGWETFYGTTGGDVDLSTSSTFTVDKPLKHGDKIKFDVTDIAAKALSNSSFEGIMRFAIRPKANQYGVTGMSSGPPTTKSSSSGLGLHFVGIDRTINKPQLILNFRPSNNSTKERLARLRRGV